MAAKSKALKQKKKSWGLSINEITTVFLILSPPYSHFFYYYGPSIFPHFMIPHNAHGSNKSTGNETGKTHLCAMCWLMQFNETPWPYTDMLLYAYWGCRLYRKNCKKVLCVERIKRNSKRNARMWLQKKLFNILTRVRSLERSNHTDFKRFIYMLNI